MKQINKVSGWFFWLSFFLISDLFFAVIPEIIQPLLREFLGLPAEILQPTGEIPISVLICLNISFFRVVWRWVNRKAIVIGIEYYKKQLTGLVTFSEEWRWNCIALDQGRRVREILKLLHSPGCKS